MEVLKKKRSHFKYVWNWNKTDEWYILKKIKNKDGKVIDEHTIIKQDKKAWDNLLKNDGWEIEE